MGGGGGGSTSAWPTAPRRLSGRFGPVRPAAAAGLLAALLAAPAAAQNAAGAPAVSGLWAVGEALAASTDDISDPQGLSSAAFAHQWVRVAADGAETDIGGATSSTHTLAPADQGGRVKVRVSFSDDAGNPESRTSAAYPASGSVLPEPCGLDHPHTTLGTELWKATVIVGTDGSRHGFSREGGDLYGALSTDRFNFLGVQRRVVRLDTAEATGTAPDNFQLSIDFSPAIRLSDASTLKLVLQTCDEGAFLPFLDTSVGAANTFDWDEISIDWRDRPTRRVRLYDDSTAPRALSAVVSLGGSVLVRLSEPIAPKAFPIVSPFDVHWTEGGVSHSLSPLTLAIGNAVFINVDEASIRDAERVSVRYQPTEDAYVTDLAGNRLASFTNLVPRVANRPTLRSQVLAADGMTLTLTFDEDLDAASVPPAGAFTVRVGGAARPLAPVNPVAVAGRAVVLRLAEPVGAGEAVTVAYDKPGSG